MMQRRFIFSSLFLLLACLIVAVLPLRAEAESLTVDLARDHVDITTGFTGSELVLFGMAEKNADVAVVIRGPRKDVVVRQKGRFLGAWLNRDGVTFEEVPLFYDYALNRPEDEFMDEISRRNHGIGLSGLMFKPRSGRYHKETLEEFEKALIRNRQAIGLFPQEPRTVTFLNDQLFKVVMHVPANVPTGAYEIQTFLVKGKNVKEVRTTKLTVAQVGFSAGIYKFSHNYAFSYALLCLSFAVFAGWFSNRASGRG